MNSKFFTAAVWLLFLCSPVLASASMVCSLSKYFGHTEVLSLQQKADAVQVVWSNTDFTSVQRAIKYAQPGFSDQVVGVAVSFNAGECRAASSNAALNHCVSQQQTKILIALKSGKKLSFNGTAALNTLVSSVSQVGEGGGISSEDTHMANLALTFLNLSTKPLYALINSVSGAGIGVCKY